MAIQKITGDVIATSAVTADSLADTTITAAKLHTTLDLTGKTVTVSTASAGDNDTTVASTAFVATAVANLADSAPDALNTLNELAAALGDDANFSTTVTNSIALKAPLASPTFTGNAVFDTTTLVVDASNNKVGIGTNSPSQKLSVVGTSSVVPGRFTGAGNTNTLEVFGNSTTDESNGLLVSAGTSANDYAAYFRKVDGTTPIMMLEGTGNIGIGVNNPDQKLVVKNGNIKLESNNDGNNGILMFYDAAGNASGQVYPSAGDLRIWSPNDVLILPTGNIGIGTDNPQAHLHVFKGESGAPTPLTDSTLILENSTHNYLQFLGPNTTQQGIVFGDADDDNVASVAYNHNTDDLDITALDNVSIVADVLNYSNSAGTGYFHMSGSSSRYADSGFWVANNYQLEVGNAHMYLKTQTSAKDIILGTHNTERMRISGSGHHIGMGTGNHFVIAEDGAGTYLGKDNNSSLRFITANGTRMTITNTGLVGIGTSDPISLMTIAQTAGNTALTFQQTNNGTTNFLIGCQYNVGNAFEITPSTAAGGSTFSTPGLVVTSAGNVGIGDTSPGHKLEVKSTENYKAIHIKGTNAPCYTMARGDGTSAEWRMGLSGYDYNDFAISSGTGTNDRFRIDPDGNMILGSANNFTPIDMHKDVATVSVRGPIAMGYANGSYGAGPRNLRDWFVYAGPTSGQSRYVHMKTDLWAGGSPNGNTEYTMSVFRYHSAYSYGNAKVSEGMIGWHNWAGATTHQRIVHNPVSNWAIVKESYTSSDGYVVLVADILTTGSYTQFSIDWCQWAGYPFRERKVTAVTLNASATGAY